MARLIAVVFQVKNEERQIGKAIESAKLLTSNIIVMDMQSTDNTAHIARKLGAKVINIVSGQYVELVRNLAFSKTNSEWVLILDADEQMTTNLAKEIKETIADTPFTHFYIPRRNIFNGKVWLRYGGWWPDTQIRLIKHDQFIDWPKSIHSTVKVNGKQGILKNFFLHNFHGNLSEMVNKTIKFENIEADLLFNANRHVSNITFFRKFLGELNRRLIIHRGWKDKEYGIIESLYQAYSKTITWLFLWEKKLNNNK